MIFLALFGTSDRSSPLTDCGALLGLLEIDCWQYETVTFYQDAIKIVM
jgi:hypothetical protein